MAASIGTITATTTNSFFTKLNKIVERGVIARIAAIEPQITEAVKEVARKHIRINPVFLGISRGGANERNLQAEFGLTEAMATDAAEQIIQKIPESIGVVATSLVGSRRSGFGIKIDGLSPRAFESQINLNAAPFSYTNKSRSNKTNGLTIPWMLWVLDASRTIVEESTPHIQNYGIIRNYLFDKERSVSRSGEAVMSGNRKRAKGFPYVLPSFVIPKNARAKNFIDEIYRSNQFRKEAKEAIFKVLRRAFRSRNRVIK